MHDIRPFLQPRDSSLPLAQPRAAQAQSGDQLWCLVCERTFTRGQLRRVGEQLLCPYTPCEGGLLFEPWDWSAVRGLHPEYPATPQAGVVYPFFGAEDCGHPAS